MASRAEEKRRARAQREQREADQRSREQRTKRIWQLGAAVVVAAAVVIVAIVVGTAGKSKVTPPSIFNGIPQHGNVLGNPNARVTMTEFADLQCPFCREYTAKVMPTLVRRYVRTGKVKMAFQDIAFLGDDSVTAGRAAAAAGLQNRLWQFVDVAYADQGDENSGYVTDGWIKDVAGKVPGLDVNRLMSDRNAASTSAAIQQAQSEGRRLGVTTTPTFFLQRGTGPMKRIEFSDFTPGAFTGSIDSALAG
jgi:protein-disulfide isomerase